MFLVKYLKKKKKILKRWECFDYNILFTLLPTGVSYHLNLGRDSAWMKLDNKQLVKDEFCNNLKLINGGIVDLSPKGELRGQNGFPGYMHCYIDNILN